MLRPAPAPSTLWSLQDPEFALYFKHGSEECLLDSSSVVQFMDFSNQVHLQPVSLALVCLDADASTESYVKIKVSGTRWDASRAEPAAAAHFIKNGFAAMWHGFVRTLSAAAQKPDSTRILH